jgi:acyl carrier protein
LTGGDATLASIRAIVEEVAGSRRIPAQVGPETRLSEGGFWLDSVELLQVVVACEERFGIVFDANQDLTPEPLETLATLTALVRAKRPRSP